MVRKQLGLLVATALLMSTVSSLGYAMLKNPRGGEGASSSAAPLRRAPASKPLSDQELNQIVRSDGYLEKLQQLANQQNDPGAQIRLADMYFEGYRGVKKSPLEGKRLLEKAASQNNIDAQLELGERLFTGRGIKADIPEGIRLLTKVANHSNHPQVRIAQEMLGNYYLMYGKNPDKAIFYLTKAAEAGVPEAQAMLGEAYARGEYGVPVDKPKAIRWLTKADEIGVGHHASDLLQELLEEERREAAQPTVSATSASHHRDPQAAGGASSSAARELDPDLS